MRWQRRNNTVAKAPAKSINGDLSMLSNLSQQYLPQGWGPQYPGFQGIGSPQQGAGSFGQSNPFGGNGYDSAQAGIGQQQFPFGGQTPQAQFGPQSQGQNPYAGFAINPYLQGQGNPYAQAQQWANPFGQNPFANNFGQTPHHPAHQIVPALAQLAQQIALQSAMTQQIGAALHQLAQHLAGQGAQAQQGFGLGGGQPFAGLNSQAQAWGANRPTIQ
jgi:hypothetical protein